MKQKFGKFIEIWFIKPAKKTVVFLKKKMAKNCSGQAILVEMCLVFVFFFFEFSKVLP